MFQAKSKRVERITTAHNPLNASSFSMSSRTLKINYSKKLFYGANVGSVKISANPTQRFTNIDNAMHHGFMKCSTCGATRSGRIHASLPRVIALFSTNDLLTSCFTRK